VSFLFLTMASLGLLILSTSGDRFDLGALQGEASAWTPPPIAAQPTPDPDLVGDVTASGATTGATGVMLRNVTNTNVRIRRTPGTLGKSGDDVIAVIPAGERVEVIGGPTTVDNLTWWQVRYTSGNGGVTDGWAAEVTPSGLRILGPDQ
jgi:hypothetical protein